jgi:hypothetical protein
VANFNTMYHAILGRPVLAKFMAIPHYTYLVLKMPIEQGILSLRANLDVTYSHEKESFAMPKAIDISIRMQDCSKGRFASVGDPNEGGPPSSSQVKGSKGGQPHP